LRISVSRARPEKILALLPLPEAVNLARQPPHYPEVPASLRTSHAGAEGSIIVGKLREKTDLSFGWNAQSGEYGDLYAQGLIDPAKVARTALQDAASVAGLLVRSDDRRKAEEGRGAGTSTRRLHGFLTRLENQGARLERRASHRSLYLRRRQHFSHRRDDAGMIVWLAEKLTLNW
jgi:hypothetical protein